MTTSSFPIVTPVTATYILTLHDALPISGHTARLSMRSRSTPRPPPPSTRAPPVMVSSRAPTAGRPGAPSTRGWRSEEHTSELQSHHDIVCRLLLEKI